MHPVAGRGSQLHNDRLPIDTHEPLRTAAVDEGKRAFIDMPTTHCHQSLMGFQPRKLLMPRLDLNLPLCPDRRLRLRAFGTDAGGEGRGEVAGRGGGKQLVARPSPAAPVMRDIHRSPPRSIKLERHVARPVAKRELPVAAEEHGAVARGGFESREVITGEALIGGGRGGIERHLPAKRAGKAGAPLEHHLPHRVKPLPAPPRHPPHIALRRAAVGDVAEEVKVDDVEPPLGEDEPAVVRPAPGRRVHPGAGGVRADQMGHPVAIAADIRRRLRGIEIAIDMKEAESAPGLLGNDVRDAAALGRRIGDVEEKSGHGVALGRGKRARLRFVVDTFVP